MEIRNIMEDAVKAMVEELSTARTAKSVSITAAGSFIGRLLLRELRLRRRSDRRR